MRDTARSKNQPNPHASSESMPETVADLTALIETLYLRAEGERYNCAITSESRQLNGPYKFVQSASLSPGRGSYLDPILIVETGRPDGLAQIRANFLTPKEEHCWIFIPQLKIWIDDTTTVSAGSVASDLFLRVQLLRVFSEIEVFHTHPDGLYAALHAEGDLPSHHRLIAATPSRGDQFSAAMIEDFAGPSSSLKSHVISYYGVTSYQRTQEFRRDAAAVGGAFTWNFDSVNESAAPCDEISRICREIQDSVAFVRSDRTKRPSWLIEFTAFEE